MRKWLINLWTCGKPYLNYRANHTFEGRESYAHRPSYLLPGSLEHGANHTFKEDPIQYTAESKLGQPRPRMHAKRRFEEYTQDYKLPHMMVVESLAQTTSHLARYNDE